MHPSSMMEMTAFVNKLPKVPLKVADIGSREAGGNYKPLLTHPEWKYTGVDLQAGPNVDLVLPEPYNWHNIPDNTFDVVLSGQTMEHVERPWPWMKELGRIVRPGGVVCVIAPYRWEYHPSPLDCWRIFPDGMRAVMQDAGLTILKLHMNQQSDTVGVATKGPVSDIWRPE